MAGVLVVKGKDDHGEARYRCNWQASDLSAAFGSGIPSWQCFYFSFKQVSRSLGFSWPKSTEDIRLLVELSANEQHRIQSQALGSIAGFPFLLDCLKHANYGQEIVAALVVPRSSGYLLRSDIIPLRLIDCVLVTKVVSFARAHQFFDGKPIAIDNLQQLPNVFAASVGGMLLRTTESTPLPTSLERELEDRLSFPWLSMKNPCRQTLAIVEGGRTGPDNGGVGESIYSAAATLGIDMVVFDNPGHWLQDTRYTHWYKAFVPLKLDLHPGADFTSDIVNAVRSYEGPLDGIVTFRDHYKPYVAEAALQLGLSTESSSAYSVATDKFQTSVSEGHRAYRASSVEQASHIVQEHGLEFPLIIKPTNGFLSEGVFRIEDFEQLEAGIKGINKDRHGAEFVVEKYCDGPEVDANVVLCDEEIVFVEVCDDFPKGADVNSHGSVNSFIEEAIVLPSKLPEHEQDMLRKSLTQSLLRMGFKNGFFHIEARVENSTMEYVTKDGLLDLAERLTPAKGAQSCWLIEVNPRPPGIQGSEASKHTYGIDYWGLALLFALHDNDRVKQLSHPFKQGPQYWCDIVGIPVPKGGNYDSGDVCAELFTRRPDLAAHVSSSFCWLKKGDRVPDPGTGVNSWVSYFDVFSRESRAHLLDIAETIKQECKFSILS